MGFAENCESPPCPSRHTECPKGLSRDICPTESLRRHIDSFIAEMIAASLRCSRANGLPLDSYRKRRGSVPAGQQVKRPPTPWWLASTSAIAQIGRRSYWRREVMGHDLSSRLR
jgi:hypothetical protein